MLKFIDFWATGVANELTLIAIALCIFTIFERFLPAQPGQTGIGRLRNIAYLLFLKTFGLAGMCLWYANVPNLMPYKQTLSGFSWLFFVAMNLLINDFFYYAYHRAQHAFPFLWALHELHHSDEEINATSSFRTFWLELPIQFIFLSLPTILLFGDRGTEHAMTVSVISFGMLIFTHCNLRLPLGPLSTWICGPQVHRVHHSSLAAHKNKNFAQFFPFIDIIFGTYYAPGRKEFPPTGTNTLATDASIIRSAIWGPFDTWLFLLKKGKSKKIES